MIIDNHSLDCGAARFGPGPFLRYWPKMASRSIRKNLPPKDLFLTLSMETNPLLAIARYGHVRSIHEKNPSINFIEYFLSFLLIQISKLERWGGVFPLAEG
jgi:hypothetical protein